MREMQNVDSRDLEVNESFQEQREFLIWLRGIEKRAIVPLKWAILITALTFWALSHPRFWPPPVEVFALFTLYFMYNVGQTYFFWFSRVNVSQVRTFCITSYVVDVLFVTALIYFDSVRYPVMSGQATDFHIFYFLLILRGFALFRTPRENLVANAIIGVVFIVTLTWQDPKLPTYSSRNDVIRVVFIWLVVLMSWFIAEIITRQKAEIMKAREHLIRSENLAILGSLAAGVAHEINNPIGIISAYAEYLKKSADPGDPRVEDFSAIHREARRCENIVSELLDYARPRTNVRTQTDLAALNEEVLSFLFRRSESREIRIERHFNDRLPMLSLDVNQFKQALINILLNARQSLSEGGGVIKVSISDKAELNGIQERIEDNGCGIPPEKLSRVFDPFFTSRTGGTGLGLSITKRIVESHGGRISIHSTVGKGTTVEMFLPYDHTSPVT
jgi:signal transduction histidine kinase